MGSEVIHELLLSFVEAGANVLRLKGRGFLGPAFFLTQLSHINSPAMAVLCMACSQGIDAFSQSGLYSNHQDIAPRYSGVLLGLSNTAGVLAGVFGTVSTGYILQHGSWDDVFKVSVGLYLFGTVVWNLFSTGLKEGRRPYVIPVGGSNSLGTWGYIEAIREIEEQFQSGIDKVHAFSVYDDPDYFYDYVQGLLDGLEAGVDSRDIVNIQNAKGLGYAINTSQELKFVTEIAATTGIVLDPVYSGKAAYGMLKDMAENTKKWEGRKILFIQRASQP
ncbi:unnamed protein product [Prunus armeniaca]|uniref:Major facilitator superfamily (MFS) profile domain-containing protein n=1 Tax=Prunus armeniaca TaxID=36596 RepID=A0A6J5TM83_PRUAR|nr:unnamed protein product [Prunus armeniaca]